MLFASAGFYIGFAGIRALTHAIRSAKSAAFSPVSRSSSTPLSRISKATPAAAKPAARKEVSRVPAPITPVDGSGGREFDPETASMEDYVKVREAQREARWKEKGYA